MTKTCRNCWRPIEGENLYWQYRGRTRTRHPSCRSCRNEYNRKRLAAARLRSIPADSNYDGNSEGELLMGTTSSNGKNAPWNLHKTKPEAREVWQQFQIALDGTRTPCFDKPEMYTDYDDPRFPDDEPTGRPIPSAAEAAERCGDCPLLALCAEFAHKERPDWGLYGGEVWIAGRVRK